jgi:hypothetical protein
MGDPAHAEAKVENFGFERAGDNMGVDLTGAGCNTSLKDTCAVPAAATVAVNYWAQDRNLTPHIVLGFECWLLGAYQTIGLSAPRPTVESCCSTLASRLIPISRSSVMAA